MKEPKEGALFRLNYMREPLPLSDSPRARVRLFHWFNDFGHVQRNFAGIVERRLGIDYPVGFENVLHHRFWTAFDIGDVLSAVTIWLNMIDLNAHALAVARRIFAEEHLRYRIDDKGGVHFSVDEEFERSAQASLAGLGNPKFRAAQHALEGGLAALGVAQQSGKTLIRGVFEAVESAYLVVIQQPKVNRIAAADVDRYLKPILLDRYKGWSDAEEITSRQLGVLKSWVHVGHYYRHGTPLEQIHEPPLDLAIAVASEGMAVLRYLVAGSS